MFRKGAWIVILVSIPALVLAGILMLRRNSEPAQQAVDHAAMARHLGTAWTLLQSDRFPEAMKEIESARLSDPTSPEPILAQVDVLGRSTRFAEARDVLLKAHARWPADARITLEAVRYDTMIVRPVETEKLAREALALAPKSWEAPYYLGVAIAASEDPKRYPEAIQAFDTSFKLNRVENAPLLEMGRLYSLMGDDSKAAATLELAVRNLDALTHIGPASYSSLGHWIDQRRMAAFRLADVYDRLGRRAESKAAARGAALGSACASDLKRLVALGSLSPPDTAARARLQSLCARGVGFFTPQNP